MPLRQEASLEACALHHAWAGDVADVRIIRIRPLLAERFLVRWVDSPSSPPPPPPHHLPPTHAVHDLKGIPNVKVLELEQHCGWTKSISHHFETMGRRCFLVLAGEHSRFFRPSTVFVGAWCGCGCSFSEAEVGFQEPRQHSQSTLGSWIAGHLLVSQLAVRTTLHLPKAN